jgi:hypothetical protein
MRKKKVAGDPRSRPPGSPPRDNDLLAGGTDGNGSSRSDAPLVLGEKHLFWCGVCDHEADATWKLDRETHEPGWQIGNGWTPRCPKRGDCLCAMAAALDTTAAELKKDPLSHLSRAGWLTAAGRYGRAQGRAKPLPSIGEVGGWASALLSSDAPLDYLHKHRQLIPHVLTKYSVGWDVDRGDLTFPVFEAGEVVQLYRRKPVDGAKMRAARGRPRPPYPDTPFGRVLCLVGGEIDALTGRQIGLNAVTVSGCSLPLHAVERFAGRSVCVMFDVGEELAQVSAVAKLKNVAARVYDVRLAELGLPHGADLNDAYSAGIGANEIKQLIKEARRNA